MTSHDPRESVDEYKIAAENIRHQDTIFFANVTVFLTSTAALFAFLYGKEPVEDRWLRLCTEAGGLLVTGVFWVAAVVFLYRWNHFRRRAVELETTALRGFRQYSTMKEGRWKVRPGILAWHALYLGASVFWAFRFCIDFWY